LTGSLQSLETLPETKKRREFISPFFSKAAISRVEPSLHGAKVSQFLDTLARAEGSVVDFFLAFRCLTADVVMDYCFRSDLSALASPQFRNHTIETFVQGFDMAIVATFFPRVFSVLNFIIFSLPEKVRATYFAPVYGFETMQNIARVRVEDALKNTNTEGKYTMFDSMAHPDSAKGQTPPSKEEMVADGCLMIAAGTDTMANTLGTILWHVTQDPRVETKLLEELKRSIGEEDIIQSSQLEGEGFEYLRAVVKEGLRLSYGVPGRIIRRVPKEGAKFGDVWVPGDVSRLLPCRISIFSMTEVVDIQTGRHIVHHIHAKHRPSHLPRSIHVSA
jgi:cytochrome P450